ncbi:MAG: sensor domain-containing diguanylate cyclase [Deltaproteobacteria bacterium]|nr:sensor domain-containing diguanylate cyclase [Deltaproteobacteria bacterium]
MAQKSTCEQLEKRIKELEAKVRERQKYGKELKVSNDELLSTNQQLEAAIERANRMTFNAETTYIELNQIFNTAADGMCVIDREFHVLKINETFSKLFGIKKKQAENKKCFELIPGIECHTPGCPLTKIINGESSPGYDVEKKTADGSIISCIMSASAFRDPSGEFYGMVLNFKDITYRKQMEEKLRELATTDGLTKIYNRRHFLELSGQEFDRFKRYGAALSMLMVDVDNFKSVNDTFGHDIGDEALIVLAEIGKNILRKVDVFGRIGGEEFAALLPETDLNGAVSVAERLRQAIEASCLQTDKGTIHFSISIGAAQATERLNTMGDLLKATDKALYRAKENGRNRVEIL